MRDVATRMKEAEDELQRMVDLLLNSGRINSKAAERLRPPAACTGETAASTTANRVPVGSSSSSSDSDQCPLEWDEGRVGEWLQEVGLAHHAAAFARLRVNGKLLQQLDDADLADELSVSSRLERKRLLLLIEELVKAS